MISNYIMGTGVCYKKNQTDINTLNLKAMANDKNQIKELKHPIKVELTQCSSFLGRKV